MYHLIASKYPLVPMMILMMLHAWHPPKQQRAGSTAALRYGSRRAMLASTSLTIAQR
jgi:hypothetical protein